MTSARCPDPVQLADFMSGRLTEGRAAAVADHLQSCTACELAAARLARRDAWLAPLARHGRQIEVLLSESGFRRVAAALTSPPETPPRGQDDTLASAHAVHEPPLPRPLGPYRLLRPLGRGGMGHVFEAVHVELGKRVALKLLPGARMASTEAVERFRREMKALGRVKHANVVTAYDAGEVDGQWYLAMEYLRGQTLSALLTMHGPLAAAEACELARQAAIGLAHIHGLGLVHRDVKPSNLLLTPESLVKVFDMGLALFADPAVRDEDLSVTGQTVGTSAYMSPEQHRDSHGIDHRSDLYSLGATLFALLTGRAPSGDVASLLAGERGAEVLELLSTTAAGARPAPPRELPAVLARLLAVEPDERYQSADEVIAALAQFAAPNRLMLLDSKSGDSSASCNLPEVVGERPSDRAESMCVARSAASSEAIRKSPRLTTACILLCLLALLAGVVVVIRINSGDRKEGAHTYSAHRVTIEVIESDAVTARSPSHEERGSQARRPSRNGDVNHQAAEWALNIGGTVKVVLGGMTTTLQPDEVPNGPFHVVAIELTGNSAATSDALVPLRGLDHLEWLDLTSTPVMDDGLQHLAELARLTLQR